MAIHYNTKIITDGLFLSLDAANKKSYSGVPTTNLSTDANLLVYNNVPSDVTSTITKTSNYYDGAAIWEQSITPTTAAGVSYLTNANNPGIGVYLSGGGGSANRYTGYAIYYRSDSPLHPTTPLFTNYSNIPGWGQGSLGSNRSVSMGDGWSRGEVIWYDTVTRADNKYWAINPLSVPLNTTIKIYWAGPFKEDRNDSTHISRYVNNTRGTTVATGGGLADISGNSNHASILNGTTYISSNMGGIRCDGVDDYIATQNISVGTSFTANIIYKLNAPLTSWGPLHRSDWRERIFPETITLIDTGGTYYNLNGPDSSTNIINICYSYNGTTAKSYKNGAKISDISIATPMVSGTYSYEFGRQSGGSTSNVPVDCNIYHVSFYNRQLTDAEVAKNFIALRGRYGL